MNNATTTTMHSGKRKGEDLKGSTLTPSSKQRRTAKNKPLTAMDVMTAKKAPECAIFVNEWEAFTKKHSAMAICFKPEFWDFMEKKGLKGQGLAALLTVPSQWLDTYILDNERKKLSQKAMDGLLLLVAKEKKDLVLFWLDFCKDICNGEEECTLKIPQETPKLKLGQALLEASKLQLVRCMMHQSSHLRVEFKIADMIFLFRQLMEVDEDFADIVSLFKKNRWYYFTEDADGANGLSKPALKRSVNGSLIDLGALKASCFAMYRLNASQIRNIGIGVGHISVEIMGPYEDRYGYGYGKMTTEQVKQKYAEVMKQETKKAQFDANDIEKELKFLNEQLNCERAVRDHLGNCFITEYIGNDEAYSINVNHVGNVVTPATNLFSEGKPNDYFFRFSYDIEEDDVDADGANGSSMPALMRSVSMDSNGSSKPALKRSASMDSNGSMKIYVAKPKPRGVRVKDDILGFAWALPSGYHSHWIMAERWPIGSKRRDNMEKGHPVQVYGSKFDGTAEYICFATKRVICENDNIKDEEKLITDDLYTIPYMALKKDFLEHMELAKEDWTAEKQKEKAELPITLVKDIQSFKQGSEYLCQYNVLLERGDYGDHEELGETRQYSATIEFVLHPNLEPEYRQWVDRTFNGVVNDYVGQHLENTVHPDRDNFFISEDDDEARKLIFTYLNVHFGWDDGYDQKLYHLKLTMDDLMIQVFDACFSAPETAPVPIGGATANNYREQYKLKVRQHRNALWDDGRYAVCDEFPRKYFSFILVNNKQIPLNKEGLITSQ